MVFLVCPWLLCVSVPSLLLCLRVAAGSLCVSALLVFSVRFSAEFYYKYKDIVFIFAKIIEFSDIWVSFSVSF